MKTAEIRRVNWKSLKDLLIATAISGISMKKVTELFLSTQDHIPQDSYQLMVVYKIKISKVFEQKFAENRL